MVGLELTNTHEENSLRTKKTLQNKAVYTEDVFIY